MTIGSLLIANRGEIAIRIARAATELDIRTVAIFSEDDAESLHTRKADDAFELRGKGAAAYLDIEQIIQVALAADCDAVHPGYGFLSENALFARRCQEEGLTFVGPQPEVLDLFGDKAQARHLAQRVDVPVSPGTEGASSLAEIHEFFESLGAQPAMMIKAVAGGGGRGIRTVLDASDVENAYIRCESEALAAFGNGALYAEQLFTHARHIEVQIVGDGTGEVVHLWERECTLQRRNQKLVEIAPSPSLSLGLVKKITESAVRLAREVKYKGIGTFEFLVDASDDTDASSFIFMEANPRLQVEHTVTEEVTGVDLVKTQLQLARGLSLSDLGLVQESIARPNGYAVQLRINMETMLDDGSVRPSGGVLRSFDIPSGPGIRVDTFGYGGYRTNPNFDSLLAKLIAYYPGGQYADALRRAYRALCEFRIEGVATNQAFLQNMLRRPEVISGQVDTHFVQTCLAELLSPVAGDDHPRLYVMQGNSPSDVPSGQQLVVSQFQQPAETVAVLAPMQGMVVSLHVSEQQAVHRGQEIAVIEAMKMQHAILAETDGEVSLCVVQEGDFLLADAPILYIHPTELGRTTSHQQQAIDLDAISPNLEALRVRQAIGLDEMRPDAVARRRKTGQRTARENVADLCDPDTFIEYGSLAVAAQHNRRSLEELIRVSPADGMVTGVGSVNGDRFDEDKSRCMIMSYDYTVFAGTQGTTNHKKTDRLMQLAEQWRLPVVIFAEGGGGRPGDVDQGGGGMLSALTFVQFAKLSGKVPRLGIASGYCFAGNAALLGCCDVVIATENASIGMGGPAMIEGGGLGVFKPKDVGPVSIQSPNGVIDIVVSDEAEAVQVAKKYLAFFQGRTHDWDHEDQRLLRQLIPQDRLRAYDMRAVIIALADTDSVLELRRSFGVGIITAFVRIEGQPFGLIANNPAHLGGAIDADAADKTARFMRLCDVFGLPLISLCDTPGFMVGPDAEKTAMVRHVSRMFVTAANLSVPFFTVFIRKGYGLGAMSMCGGATHASFFSIAWPSAEFGAMGVEGAVTLGYRKELEAITDLAAREREFERMVADSYEKGQALSVASYFEIDNVIDPAETRFWLMRGIKSTPLKGASMITKAESFLDTW